MRVFNQKGEGNFPMAPDSDPPAGFDWDMFNGPAPEHVYNETLRRRWRYLWRYGGGDMDYDGIHQVDIARRLASVDYPKFVFSHGARYNRDGAAETPDTQLSVFEFDDLMMTFELTHNTRTCSRPITESATAICIHTGHRMPNAWRFTVATG